MNYDVVYMRRALQLAKRGQGQTSPNPMVGCLIVHQGKIIGEGWHRKYGQAHAEVNAIASVKDTSLLSKATVYVTLEPCAHFGKTPPCADLLVKHQVKKVVIAAIDSNPLVKNLGIEKLKNAGIDVVTGVLEEESRQINQAFFSHIEKKRPFVVLKWAETADGFVARQNYDSKWISNPQSRQLVHKYRSELDAIFVGSNTAFYDNPQLSTRNWSGKHPLRLVLDRNLKLSDTLHLFDQQIPTICYNTQKSEKRQNLEFVKLNESAILQQILTDLYHRKIQSVLVEGGSALLGFFISQNLWDEARVFKSKTTFKEGIFAPKIQGKLVHYEHVSTDTLFIYKPS